jgi:hypothetical protein
MILKFNQISWRYCQLPGENLKLASLPQKQAGILQEITILSCLHSQSNISIRVNGSNHFMHPNGREKS